MRCNKHRISFTQAQKAKELQLHRAWVWWKLQRVQTGDALELEMSRVPFLYPA